MTYRQGATFSNDNLYRYRLWQRWDEGIKPVMFLLLSPVTEDREAMMNCISRAEKLGFGGVELCHLYSRLNLDPQGLSESEDPIGQDNMSEIIAAASVSHLVICGWGDQGNKIRSEWPKEVVNELYSVNPNITAIKVDDDGNPKHPLRIGYDATPVPWLDLVDDLDLAEFSEYEDEDQGRLLPHHGSGP